MERFWLRLLAAFAALFGGNFFLSAQSSETWQPIGPSAATVFCLQQNPFDAEQYFAGTYFGGLYESTNAGASWQNVPSPFSSQTIFSIAASPSVSGELLVGLFQGGIYRSADDGASWQAITNGVAGLSIQSIVFNPNLPNSILAASFQGVFRSLDGGITWTLSNGGVTNLPGTTLCFDSTRAGRVYVGTSGLGVFQSLDNGTNWRAFSSGLASENVNSLWQDPATGDLYASCNPGMFQLPASSTNWVNITSTNLTGINVNQIISLPPAPGIFAATDDGIYQLTPTNNGLWRFAAPLQSRVLFPGDGGSVFAGATFGTLMVSSNIQTASFVPADTGIQNRFVGSLMTLDEAGQTTIFAGTDLGVQDAVAAASNAFPSWKTSVQFNGGVFNVAAASVNTNTIFAGVERDGIWKGTNYGQGWTQLSDGMWPKFIYSLSQSSVGSQPVYAGTSDGVYISTNNGGTWNANRNTATPYAVSSVLADPVRTNTVYYATSSGGVYRSFDGGQNFQLTWTAPDGDGLLQMAAAPFLNIYAVGSSKTLYVSGDDASTFFPATGITNGVLGIAADSTRPWIAYAGTLFGGVYQTTNSGATWAQSNLNLGSPIVYSVAVDRANDSIVYAGTLSGMFKSTNASGSWFGCSSGLATGAVVAVEIDPHKDQNVYASVLGAGIYQSTNYGGNWSLLLSGSNYNWGAPILSGESASSPNLLVGSQQAGVVRSANYGASWSSSSQGMTLFVRGLAIDPVNPQNMYAGSLVDGIFKTANGGQLWTPQGMADRAIYGLVVDPLHPQTVFAATSSGVVTSQDYGTTWFDSGQQSAFVFDVEANPSVPGQVFEGGASGSVYKSLNGGLSWLGAFNGLPGQNITSLAIDWANDDAYAVAELTGIYRSTDLGQTWTPSAPLANNVTNIIRLALIPGSHNVLAGTDSAGVFLSTNLGLSWTQTGLTNSDQVNDFAFNASLGYAYAATSSGVARSSDGGSTWGPIGQQAPYLLSMAVNPSNKSTIYVGSIGGQIYQSPDGGQEWTEIDDGLPPYSIFALAVNPVDGAVFASPERQGVYRSFNGGKFWLQGSDAVLGNAKVTSLSWNAANATLYASTSDQGLFYSTDEGATWVHSGLVNVGLVNNVDFDSVNSNVVYAATSTGAYRSTNGGGGWELLGQLAPYVYQVFSDPTNRSTVYAGGQAGNLYRSADAGLTWSKVGYGLPQFTIFATGVDTVRHAYFACPEQQGIYYSTDNAEDWARIDGSGLSNALVSALAVTPGGSPLFAATYGNGLLASADYGLTWNPASTNLASSYVSSVILDPFVTNTLYATVLNSNQPGSGVYVSSNAAGSWRPLTNGLSGSSFLQIVASPSIPGRLYAITTNAFFFTTNSGLAWLESKTNPPGSFAALAADASESNVLYLGADQGIFRSTDGGVSWLATSNNFGNISVSAFAQGPEGGGFYAGSFGNGVLATTDFGAVWENAVDPVLVNPVLNQIAVDPHNPGVLYAIDYELGVVKSTDFAVTWSKTGSGLFSTNVTALLIDPIQGNRIYAGTSDHGLFASQDGGGRWTQAVCEFPNLNIGSLAPGPALGSLYVASLGNGLLESHDGGTTLVDGILPDLVNINMGAIATAPLAPAICYAAANGTVIKSTNGALTWRYASNELSGVNVRRILVDPQNSSHVLAVAVGVGIFVSENGGQSWANSTGPNGPLEPTSVCSLGTPNVFAAGTTGDGFLISSNGGVTWSGGGSAVTVQPIVLGVALNPQAPQQIFAATSGTGVLLSDDGGVGWISASSGLGDSNLFAVVVDPVATNVVYAATASHGVYVSENSGASWRPLTNGLFNPVVTSLAIDADDHSLIYAGTEGGGVFRLKKSPTPEPLQVTANASGLSFAWPSGWPGFVLQETTTLNPPNWQTLSLPAILTNGQYVIQAPALSANGYFRLKLTPQ
jgi:photosystem II stability/assembly factor-like uncharacterized protein